MGKKKSEDIDMDQIAKDMRDATMDKLAGMVKPEVISKEDAVKMAKGFYYLYAAFVEIGFTKAQAMELLKHMMAVGMRQF